MQINLKLNGKLIKEEIADELLLIDFVRKHGCYSVKRGYETGNCGLCTVFRGKDPEHAYADYISGKRDYLEVSKDYR